MNPRALLLLSLAAGLAGCFTPAPVVRLTPDMPGVVWQDGRAIVASERPGLRVAVAFEEADEQIAMRVEVQNTGALQLDVDPAKMVYRTCTTETTCQPTRSVVNPEAVLVQLDQARASERAGQANDAAAGMAFLLLDATVGVLAVASGDSKTADRAMDNGARAADDASRSIEAREANISSLEAAKQKWSAIALRRTTLFPGRSMGGLLYLPIDTSGRLVWLSVRIHGEDNWFRFKQVVIEPYPTSSQ